MRKIMMCAIIVLLLTTTSSSQPSVAQTTYSGERTVEEDFFLNTGFQSYSRGRISMTTNITRSQAEYFNKKKKIRKYNLEQMPVTATDNNAWIVFDVDTPKIGMWKDVGVKCKMTLYYNDVLSEIRIVVEADHQIYASIEEDLWEVARAFKEICFLNFNSDAIRAMIITAFNHNANRATIAFKLFK